MVLLAIAAGLLIGLSLGALGGGGSILTVPALVYLLGQSPHQATTASLIVVGIAAIVGAITHARAGRARLRTGAIFGALGVAGSYAGSRASAAVPANLLLAGFGVLMLTVAATMILRRRAPGRPGTGSHSRSGARHVIVITAAATGVGLVTGFFGVGGGFVVVPALVLALGFDMPTAAGTSLVVIAVDSAAALAARAGHAVFSLDWALVAAFIGAAVLGTLAGTRLAGRVNPQRLSAAFTLLIVVVAGYTLARSLPGIVQGPVIRPTSAARDRAATRCRFPVPAASGQFEPGAEVLGSPAGDVGEPVGTDQAVPPFHRRRVPQGQPFDGQCWRAGTQAKQVALLAGRQDRAQPLPSGVGPDTAAHVQFPVQGGAGEVDLQQRPGQGSRKP